MPEAKPTSFFSKDPQTKEEFIAHFKAYIGNHKCSNPKCKNKAEKLVFLEAYTHCCPNDIPASYAILRCVICSQCVSQCTFENIPAKKEIHSLAAMYLEAGHILDPHRLNFRTCVPGDEDFLTFFKDRFILPTGTQSDTSGKLH